MRAQLVILIAYVVILLAISWWSTVILKRGTSNRTLNYLLAGRNLPSVLIMVMLVGLAVGGASTVGVAESAYTMGVSAGWYNAAWGLGGIFVGLFVARHLRRMTVKTVPQIMGQMFGPWTRFFSVICQLLVMISITALQYVAGGAILTALLPDVFTLQQGMLASCAIFIFITLFGGYWASGLTNLFNVVLIYVGIVVALVFGLRQFGGFESLLAQLPAGDNWFHPVDGLGLPRVLGYVAVMVTMATTTQAVSQICFAARDERMARNGFIIGGIIILPAGFLCAFFGIMAAVQFPELGPAGASLALPKLVTGLTPLVGGLFLASLWAADISTAVGLLMGCSTLVLEDVVKKVYRKPLQGSKEMLVSRLVVLVVSLLSFALALTIKGILATITTALALTTSFTIAILAGIYLPRIVKRAAGLWLVLASLALWLLWTFFPSLRVLPHLIYAEWIACGLILAGFAVFAKEPAGDIFARTKEQDDEEADIRRSWATLAKPSPAPKPL
ncbi:MAG: sodium:solute symporter family protein [Deltaproteobacteria bacterium]|nr:sodium:solute symporter family protein [Deltaproteobacteria bacterium]